MPSLLSYTLALVAERAGQSESQAFNLYTKEFVDALSHPRNLCPERQWAMIEAEPAALQAPWMDVSLAAIAEFVAQRSGLTTPAWAQSPGRFLAQPRLWGVRPHTRAHMLGETPGPFRRRNLFMGHVWLFTRRWGGCPEAAFRAGCAEQHALRAVLDNLGQQMAAADQALEIALLGRQPHVFWFDMRKGDETDHFIPLREGSTSLKEAAQWIAARSGFAADEMAAVLARAAATSGHDTPLLGDFPSAQPGVRIMQATPSYVFALRAMAAVGRGVTDADRTTLRALWQSMPTEAAGRAHTIVASYHPGNSLPAALRQVIDEVTDADHLVGASPLPVGL